MKSKQLTEKKSVFVALEATTQTMELTSAELTNVDGGCDKCDRNHDGRISWIEMRLCHRKPIPIPRPKPHPRPIQGPY